MVGAGIRGGDGSGSGGIVFRLERGTRSGAGLGGCWGKLGNEILAADEDATEVGAGKEMWSETQALPSDLAGVLALLSDTGTHHGVRDVAGVGVLTLLVLDDGDVGTSQGTGQVHCRGDMRGHRE